MIELAIIIGSIATALLLARQYPTATRRWFNRIAMARTAIYAVLMILVAFVFISSGSLLMMVWGGAILVLITLGILFESPFETVRRAI